MKILLCSLIFFFEVIAIQSKTTHELVVEIYPLGLKDFDVAEQLAKAIISQEGKLVGDRENHRLILYDYPTVHEKLKRALEGVQSPNKQVKFQLSFDSSENSSLAKVHSGNNLTSDKHRKEESSFEKPQASAIQQELVVMSGGRGRLKWGKNIPYQDWMWNYGLKNGYWRGGSFWKEVHANLVLEPYVFPDFKVRVRWMPEFQYSLKGQTFTTTLERLTTEVVVTDKEEIYLENISNTDPEFYSKFFSGYTYLGEAAPLKIVLLVSVEASDPLFLRSR